MMEWFLDTVDVANWTWLVLCLCAGISMTVSSLCLSYSSRRLQEAMFYHDAAQSIYNEILGEDE